jgi:hypothetical protein
MLGPKEDVDDAILNFVWNQFSEQHESIEKVVL